MSQFQLAEHRGQQAKAEREVIDRSRERKFLRGSFARCLSVDLVERGYSHLDAQSIVARLFNKGARLEERYLPEALESLEAPDSKPRAELLRIAARAVRSGDKVMASRFPELLLSEGAPAAITHHFVECIRNKSPIVDGVNEKISEIFNAGGYDLGERAQRSARRTFWAQLGFTSNPSGKPILWTLQD